MRVLVTGSRRWGDREAVRAALAAAAAVSAEYGTGELTVVHGHCPTGADAQADEWARDHADRGVTVERHPADWRRLGKAAGPIRNHSMVQLGADLCLAFLTPDSRGTRDCVRRAEEAGIPVRRFHSGQAS